MHSWRFLLGGMIVWTVHFFALYIAVSIFLETPLTRLLVALATLACLAANGWLFRRIRRSEARGDMDRMVRQTGQVAIGMSALAIVWQALPALMV